MNSAGFGFLLLVVAGLMNASFAVPMKYTRRWSWENTWMVWTFFALVVLPAAVAFVTLPDLAAVYLASDFTLLWHVVVFGAGWGLAQVFFGIAVDALGIAMTFSLVLGTSPAMGALIPMLMLHSDKLHTSVGHLLLLGIAMLLACIIHEHIVNSFLSARDCRTRRRRRDLLQPQVAASVIGTWRRRSSVFGTGLSRTVAFVMAIGMSFGGAMPFYPGEAPSSSAMCRKVARNGNDCGRCTTMRRTEPSTRAPSFRKRSRSVQTCPPRPLVPAALRRSSCIST